MSNIEWIATEAFSGLGAVTTLYALLRVLLDECCDVVDRDISSNPLATMMLSDFLGPLSMLQALFVLLMAQEREC